MLTFLKSVPWHEWVLAGVLLIYGIERAVKARAYRKMAMKVSAYRLIFGGADFLGVARRVRAERNQDNGNEEGD